MIVTIAWYLALIAVLVLGAFVATMWPLGTFAVFSIATVLAVIHWAL